MTDIINYFSLTLKQQENILDGITLYEPIDTSTLEKLINSNLLKKTFNNPVSKKLYSTEKSHLIHYRDIIENGKAVVKYDKYKNNPFGRSNPKGALGLFSIRREIRHTLAKDEFEDVDIDNAHPHVQMQILNANNIDCDLLKSYSSNREDWFNIVRDAYKIGDRRDVKEKKGLFKDIPKNLFIRILYGGGIWKWKKDWGIPESYKTPQKLLDFIAEVDRISKVIVDANPELVDIVKKVKIQQGKIDADGFYTQTEKEIKEQKKKVKFNLNGSVCSFFLQEKEVLILEHIFKYCVSKEYIKDNIAVLCADGIMIQKKYYKPSLLKELEILVKLKTGFELKFSNKAMDEDYLEVLDKHLIFDLYTPTFTTGLLANYFKTIYSNKYINVAGSLYNYNGLVWKKENDKKNAKLHNFVDTTFYNHLISYISKHIEKQTKKIIALGVKVDDAEHLALVNAEKMVLGKMSEFLQNVNASLRTIKKRKEIVEDIINKISCSYIEFDNDAHLLAFENKIFSLKTNSWVEPTHSQYISITTGWDWCDYSDVELKVEMNKILDSILPIKEVRKYYLTALSTGLFGQQIQKIFVASGIGGNGKSVLNGLMISATGDYGYTLPSSVLLGAIKDGANPAIANLNKKRFGLTSEPNGKKKICSATLKEITGNSKINSRGLYSDNCDVYLFLSLFLECNKIPDIDEVGVGVERRFDVFDFVSRFVESNKYNEFSQEEIKKQHIFIGNPYYTTPEFKVKYRQALVEILFEHFKVFRENNYQFPEKPKECKAKEKDYLMNSDEIYSWFGSYYEKCDENLYEKVFVSDLYDIFKSSDYFFNMAKEAKRILNKNKFETMINDSLFLKAIIQPAGKYCKETKDGKSKKQSKAFIVNFRRIPEEIDVSIEKNPDFGFVSDLEDVETDETDEEVNSLTSINPLDKM